MANLGAENAWFILLIAVFVVVFALMGIRLLAKVIDFMVRWLNGRRNARR